MKHNKLLSIMFVIIVCLISMITSNHAYSSDDQLFLPGSIIGTLSPAVRGVSTQATETDPPPILSNCEEMHIYRVAAGLPAIFDTLGKRESNCRNEDGVHTHCCYGYWQLWIGLQLKDHRMANAYHTCGVYSAQDVNSDTPGDKMRQACATKALYDVVGLSPWS